MTWPNLHRARRLQRQAVSRIGVSAFGVCLAFLIPILVLILGLIVQLLVGQENHNIANDWALGPWVSAESWPLFGRKDHCLLALVGAGLMDSLLIAVCMMLLQGSVHRAAMNVIEALKESIHKQSFRLGSSEFMDQHRTRADKLFMENVELIRQGLTCWWRAIPGSLVGLISLVVLAMMVKFQVTLLAILMALMIWRTYIWLRNQSDEASGVWRVRADQRHKVLMEGLKLAPFTTNLMRSRASDRAFNDNLRNYCIAALKSRISNMIVRPVLVFVVLLSAACMLLVIGLLVFDVPPGMSVAGSITLGTALICAYFPAVQLYRLPGLLEPAERAAGEIFDYLEREPRVLQLSGARVLERIQSGIELDRVTLADFNGNRLLDEISLTVPAGGRVGMLALDPRTPMALAGLFIRFYDPAFGRILFDRHDIRHVTLDSLREQAAMVRTENVLFTGPVSENIDCGDSRFSLLQITDAAKRAGAYEFIQQLPQGFSTIVGEHGEQLNQRQAFRIALARAMLRDPSLLVIEEPEDGNGEDSADDIATTLDGISTNRTMIYLPNRLNTLRSLDRIFVFHEGSLHAAGNHAELLQASDLYRHLNYVRFNPFRASTSKLN